MKLTKLQRYTAYVIMLAEYEEMETKEFLCDLMQDVLGLETMGTAGQWMHENLAELWAVSKKEYVWFYIKGDNTRETNRKLRIAALQQCINETHP